MTTAPAHPATPLATPDDPASRVTVAREGRGWVLRAEQVLPRSLDELWPFFADAHNLEELTPPLLSFNVLTPRPIKMREGALIEYKLRVRGVPIRWKTEILAWEPPGETEPGRRRARFVDNQLKGPYARWHHEHTFEEHRDGERDIRTVCGDVVHYEVPGWFLAPLVNAIAVERDVRNIFRFRARIMAERFGRPQATSA